MIESKDCVIRHGSNQLDSLIRVESLTEKHKKLSLSCQEAINLAPNESSMNLALKSLF